MAEIRIDDDYKVTGRVVHPVDISSSQSQFRGSGLQHNLLLAIELLQILGHVQSTIWTAIIDDDYLVVVFARRTLNEI